MKRIFIISIMSILLTNCSFNYKQKNNEKDLKDAEQVSSALFKELKDQDFESAIKFLDKRFLEETPEEEMMKLFERSNDSLGQLINTELYDWNSEVSYGTNTQGIYNLIYNASFEKGEAIIKMTIIKYPNGVMKILGYHSTSKVFE
ncbi:DUF3887 domain-containing protein [Altibacter lentus]|uniref:DUF3887 domain-containing protein n=1 Tax=Altibacter lentus TaxID=1223410 RepID=UPI001267990E|nr:DUF3887 domain-containing protein [Altibacter lentus]